LQGKSDIKIREKSQWRVKQKSDSKGERTSRGLPVSQTRHHDYLVAGFFFFFFLVVSTELPAQAPERTEAQQFLSPLPSIPRPK
jgi:hypothetical protein